MNNDLSNELIQQELEKLGIKPNPQSEVKATDAATSTSEKEKQDVADIEKKIKQLQRKATYQIKLDANQLEQLERLAAGTGRSWKEELTHQLETKVFQQKIGQAKISRPSNTTLVTGPSNANYLPN